MNFLELCSRLGTESGVSGSISTVTGVTGEWSRIVNWIQQAWVEIQEENPEWNWMRKPVSFDTIANQSTYTPTSAPISLTDFASWREDSFRIYLTSAGVGTEWLLPFRDYNSFRDYWLLSSRKITYARPTEITVAPNKDLILGLAPDSIYTVSGEYYKQPVILSADADTPDMPSRFHMAIVYRAMMFYGGYESASDAYSRGESQYKAMMNNIRYDQMPSITRGGSLI